MIVGKGDLASALIDRDDLLYFAMGVSNSQETREEMYNIEKDILLSMPKTLRLVYFGSLSIFYKTGRYQQHKLQMEHLVRSNFPDYCIVRLGNITWGNNPNTIINYLRNRYKEDKPLVIEDTTRYLIDVKEFQHWLGLIPDWNCELNITGQPMTVQQIVDKYIK